MRSKSYTETKPFAVLKDDESPYHKRFYILLDRPNNLQETVDVWLRALDITFYIYDIAQYAKTKKTTIIPTFSDNFNQSNQIFDKSIFSKIRANEIDLAKFCNLYNVKPVGRDRIPDKIRNAILKIYRENHGKTIYFRINFDDDPDAEGIRFD